MTREARLADALAILVLVALVIVALTAMAAITEGP